MSAPTSVGKLALTALVAGLVAAVVEMLFVLPIQALMLHHSPELVFQSIAMGAIGRGAFKGGLTTAAEGVGWHCLVSIGAAAVYGAAAVRWRWLLDRPALGGILFGVVVYIVMIFVVIPLSAIGFNMPTASLATAMSFAIHLLAFGLPIGLVTTAMLGRETTSPSA